MGSRFPFLRSHTRPTSHPFFDQLLARRDTGGYGRHSKLRWTGNRCMAAGTTRPKKLLCPTCFKGNSMKPSLHACQMERPEQSEGGSWHDRAQSGVVREHGTCGPKSHSPLSVSARPFRNSRGINENCSSLNSPVWVRRLPTTLYPDGGGGVILLCICQTLTEPDARLCYTSIF